METQFNAAGSVPETTAIRTEDIDVSSLGPVCLKVPKLILPREYFNGAPTAREKGESSKAYLRRTYMQYAKEISEYFTTLHMRVKSTFTGPPILYVILNGKSHPGNIFSYDNCTVNEAMQFISALDAIAFVENLNNFPAKVVETTKKSKVALSGGARRRQKRAPAQKKETTQFDIDSQLINDMQNTIEKFVTKTTKLIRENEKQDFVAEIIASDIGSLMVIQMRYALKMLEELIPTQKKKITTWQERDAAFNYFISAIDILKSLSAMIDDAQSALHFLPEDCLLFSIGETLKNDMLRLGQRIVITTEKLRNVPIITILSFNSTASKYDKRYASYLSRVVQADTVPNMSDDIVTAIQSVIPDTCKSFAEKVAYCRANKLPIVIE